MPITKRYNDNDLKKKYPVPIPEGKAYIDMNHIDMKGFFTRISHEHSTA